MMWRVAMKSVLMGFMCVSTAGVGLDVPKASGSAKCTSDPMWARVLIVTAHPDKTSQAELKVLAGRRDGSDSTLLARRILELWNDRSWHFVNDVPTPVKPITFTEAELQRVLPMSPSFAVAEVEVDENGCDCENGGDARTRQIEI